MEKRIFLTDLNLVRLAIFSTSKGLAVKKPTNSGNQQDLIPTEPVHIIEFGNGRHVLKIKYGNRIPSWFDRKVLASIEWLFVQRFPDLQILRDELNQELQERITRYFDEGINLSGASWSDTTGIDPKVLKTFDDPRLTDRERQDFIFDSIARLQIKYSLFIPIKTVNKLLVESYASSTIKASITTLGETIIESESTYTVGDSPKLTKSTPLLSVKSHRADDKKRGSREIMIISLSPFHLYNLLNSRFVKSDLDFLTSFSSPIAGRLSEYLGPKLYGVGKKTWKPYVMPYKDLCKFLHLSYETARSRVLTQLTDPLNEMMSCGVIKHWELRDGTFEREIWFYHTLNFFIKYFGDLSQATKDAIVSALPTLREDAVFKQRLAEFISFSGVSKEDGLTISCFEAYLALSFDQAD